MKVPKQRIPKAVPVCTTCGGKVTTLMGAPHAEGYFRRHKCIDPGCAKGFYSLTPYDGKPAKLSDLPFKDRELTDREAEMRLIWWREAGTGIVTIKVTEEVFLKRIQHALNEQEATRTPQDQVIVDKFKELKDLIGTMDALYEKDS